MPTSDDALLAFYSGTGRDIQGRSHADILAWSDAALEAVHDYIQWLFPLPEPSGANPFAPLVTARVEAEFRASEQMRGRLRAAWLRMLRFYGLGAGAQGVVVRTGFFAERARNWLTPYNHNHLRLTRILRSLHVLGLEQESAALFRALEAIYVAEPMADRRITPETFGYWQRATR